MRRQDKSSHGKDCPKSPTSSLVSQVVSQRMLFSILSALNLKLQLKMHQKARSLTSTLAFTPNNISILQWNNLTINT
eukprot:scaffold9681_cov103-Skeletonema_dohrnii-CCMP3373.AAC.4